MTAVVQPQDAGRKRVRRSRRLVPVAVPAADGTARQWRSADELLENWQITHATDLGNAKRFARDHRGKLFHCSKLGRWYWFDGTVWRADPSNRPVHAIRAAEATVRSIYTEAAAMHHEAQRKTLSNWAQTSESESRLRAMVRLAEVELAVDVAALDGDPMLLNVQNGTLDLRTGRLRPHRPDDYLTKIAAAPYEPEAFSPLWAKALTAAQPDETVRHFLQRFAGYTLAGMPTQDVFALLHGVTRSGKGTIQLSIANTLGDYAQTAQLSMLGERTRPGGPRSDLVRLRGARMVNMYETQKSLNVDAALVKTLTGSDPISARDLYTSEIEFRPQCVIWIATNYRPHMPSDDDALWERFREVPFEHHIPEEQRDPKVREKLTDPSHSGAAILAWMMLGYDHYRAQGLGYPVAIRKATAANREEQDPASHVRRFVADACELVIDAWTRSDVLRAEYASWAPDHAAPHQISDADWGRALSSAGCRPMRRHEGRGWMGVRLQSFPSDLEA
jgi:putative DNA primase/helicase